MLHGQLMREHLELERSQAMLMLHNSIIERQVHNQQLECGPMPNVMAALRNIGSALCSTPQGLADTYY